MPKDFYAMFLTFIEFPMIIASVSFHMELFHIERGFYSRMEIEEREIEGKTAHIMNAVGNRTCLAVCPAPLPPPLI